MKTRKNIYFKVVALAAIAIAFAMPAKAQLSDNGYANIDWQFNAPLSNHFADKASGWGMNFEGGYFVTPNIGLGLFLNYHSNHEYVGRETFQMGAGYYRPTAYYFPIAFRCCCTLPVESWRVFPTLCQC